MVETADFVIIGGGVMGLSLALNIKRRYASSKIVLLEKEMTLGAHASGRNSGVIHAGFYYSADSMKARFTRQGNVMMRAYCQENGLKINDCGKLVVCKDESELVGAEELLRRARANRVPLEMITRAQAQEIEPRVNTFESALWSPTTASVDPIAVVSQLAADAKQCGVLLRTNAKYLGREGKRGTTMKTTSGLLDAGYIINAAGLHADKIARDFGFSRRYRILPFKGLYLYSSDKEAYRPNVHIYPVPDLDHPFLGVHFTLTVDGLAKIGPTAIPAFWRENYGGFNSFDMFEAKEILVREARLWLGNNFGFRSLAWKEFKKYRKGHLISSAAQMLRGSKEMGFRKWGRPGIRAQLIDIVENRLEMDFIYEMDNQSFHLLNAVSPAFTCSLSISEFLTQKIENVLSSGE